MDAYSPTVAEPSALPGLEDLVASEEEPDSDVVAGAGVVAPLLSLAQAARVGLMMAAANRAAARAYLMLPSSLQHSRHRNLAAGHKSVAIRDVSARHVVRGALQ
jgi:hypothetical protein